MGKNIAGLIRNEYHLLVTTNCHFYLRTSFWYFFTSPNAGHACCDLQDDIIIPSVNTIRRMMDAFETFFILLCT